MDTENGLLVPVIRDVDKKSVAELAEELTAVADRARQRKLDAAELKGGTFTITNLGGIGGTGFTPIVNYPEVAILGLSRGRLEPVVRDGEITPRLMLPLSLSYDHRVIDGAAAARFTRRAGGDAGESDADAAARITEAGLLDHLIRNDGTRSLRNCRNGRKLLVTSTAAV